MPESRSKRQAFQSILMKWLPALLTGIILFAVPPAAIAVIIAYFTAPILSSVRSMTKLPLTIATLLVMTLMLFFISAFTFIAIHGLIDTIPAVENHIAPFTQNADIPGKLFTFLEDKVVEYGHALLEYSVTIISTAFQQLFSLFIFLVSYFFALRESGKNRYWFLVYFPLSIRKPAKRMFTESGKLIGTFVSVEARLFFLTFLIITTGFFFLRFESPVGNAFLISLADSLPFLGIGLFLLPMAAFFLYTNNLFLGISIILLYLFTMITRQMAESYMWASTFQVKPIHAFFITASSFYLFGLPGILLTPFLLFAALKIRQHPLFTV
ncbi:AI-2E family transporter [Sporosarcina sp. JAI121]|uniref:AI-2E family transporter n=1 Tax=Sporosarcina sp. JAI121 TaxID=2723064 RepID=UPI0015C8333B|nr:AI-2E family transporter [Sporosarcina sp. JAI121]NYF25161.1 putative PurR-regulated permease PerM [Sporosarcina sp. JAI121]